jgi:glucosamine--fructose-6-phosphate aminotransferase (isomerizing)
MCGIVAYIGEREAAPIVLDGLKRLEYRGYDSAGVVVQCDGVAPYVARAQGRVNGVAERAAADRPQGTVAVAHTRWATHGEPSERNAHPQADPSGKVHVVHNGIIENYKTLRDKLESEGHTFASDTDTEVIAHLIAQAFRGTLEDAVTETLRKLRGTWAIAVVHEDDPGKIVAARNSSPLLLGVGEREYLLASDASAVLSSTNTVVYLEDGEMVTVTRDNFRITNVDDKELRRRLVEIPWTIEEAEKSGYDHFMRKEIDEAPETVRAAMRGRVIIPEGDVKLGGLEGVAERLRHAERFVLTGMGTAYYAAMLGEYFFEEIAGVPAEVEYAAEFRYRNAPVGRNSALIAVSQSGETIDTLSAVREARRRGMLTLGNVNVVGSTIARETDAGVYNHAGPEIGVASTKAFISQVSVLVLMAIFLGRQRGLGAAEAKRLLEELARIPELIEQVIAKEPEIRALAEALARYENALFIGRKWSYPIALEGALKLKEVSYLHAEGYNAAEMKHGPIALIDEQFPTIAIAPEDPLREKVLGNIEEIRARRGPVFAFGTEGDTRLTEIADTAILLPRTHEMLSPLVSVVPLQLLAYHVGVLRNLDVDKPRNLAKSVTVE